MLAVARPRSTEERQYTSWDRARLSVVVPIGVIVAVAIMCIVIAVLSTAQRADEVAVKQEVNLFIKAVAYRGGWSQRKLESVAKSYDDRAGRRDFNLASLRRLLPASLNTLMDHEYVFVADSSDRLAYLRLGDRKSTRLNSSHIQKSRMPSSA